MASVEIACDESGAEGEKLVGGETDVFAHAGVRLSVESAAECVQEIRNRIRSPALEYKANHLLREKNRSVLVWLLSPAGPIHGNARVHLTDKAFFLLGKVTDLLVGPHSESLVVTLSREGSTAVGRAQWTDFLEAGNNLMRVKNRRAGSPVDPFFTMVDAMLPAVAPGRVRAILELFRRARPRAEAFRTQVLDNPLMIPPLDSWIPAIVQAVAYWGAGGKSVSIVHDEQLTLSEERISQLKTMIGGRLTGIRLVDSRSDARVQIADFLAGVARRISSEELGDRGDAELIALLAPYVDPRSIWMGP
ncbi:MAG: hypothetical protein QOI21_132 [Actinomycetota bacterium]|nr:hypothetical protein [Actinomycetota bacterium]